MRDRELKMCVVGSPAAGKTCLIIRYTENTFPEGNPPTVVDVTSVPVALTERVFLFLVGTTLAEMNQSFATTNIPWCQHTVRHAPTTYSRLICFDVCSQYSFEAVTMNFCQNYINTFQKLCELSNKSDLCTIISHLPGRHSTHLLLEQLLIKNYFQVVERFCSINTFTLPVFLLRTQLFDPVSSLISRLYLSFQLSFS